MAMDRLKRIRLERRAWQDQRWAEVIEWIRGAGEKLIESLFVELGTTTMNTHIRNLASLALQEALNRAAEQEEAEMDALEKEIEGNDDADD